MSEVIQHPSNVPPKKVTLRDLLEKQVAALDEFLDQIPDEEFSPEKLAELQLDIKDKVDAIAHKLKDFERQIEFYEEEYIRPWTKARDAIRKRMEGLRKYVHQQMSEKGYDKLPGNHWRVQFQKSAPALRFHVDPSPQLYLNPDYRDYLVQDVTYRWNAEAVKASLAGGTSLTFAELSHSRYIKFYSNKKNEAEK